MTNRHRMSAAQRRQAIVEAAVKLFAERGFRGTTTKELAAAVGVSEPVLYQHFANKRALHDAILKLRSRNGPGQLERLLAPFAKAGDDRAFFRRLAEHILDWYISDPSYTRLLLFSALEREELSNLFYERQIKVFYRSLTRYIERRMKEGALRKMDPLLAARLFAGMVGHQGMVYSVYRPAELPAGKGSIAQAATDVFLEGMRTSEKNHS